MLDFAFGLRFIRFKYKGVFSRKLASIEKIYHRLYLIDSESLSQGLSHRIHQTVAA